jgi:hypothetical protein
MSAWDDHCVLWLAHTDHAHSLILVRPRQAIDGLDFKRGFVDLVFRAGDTECPGALDYRDSCKD